MTAGMAFYKDGYSRIACCPTKLGEYLGCGVPCIASAGVGDVGEVLENQRVGVAMRGFSDSELRSGIGRIIGLVGQSNIQNRCRRVATELFSLQGGVEKYDSIYRSLA
jgi:hypothetical protein